MIESSTLVTIITACGGLGIFLLGLIIMTDGLHTIAGDKLRSIMLSFTKSPYSGAASGTIMTAILQSSSATTVAAVGFVSAGVLTFTQALGIIFGANLGTTITGWIVAVFGFKLKLGLIVLPLIFIGTILKLFAKKELASIGYVLAGFGLIFVGIATMQEAMQNIQGIITPEHLPSDTIMGRLKLIAIGIFFTVITQSSSAGVAATLTALFAGAINFQQAAALVIGMDIGTTITALIATIGRDINTRRTGFSHTIYNFITAIGAFILITPFVNIWEYFNEESIVNNAEIALVAFHTTFNLLGVVLILPFTNYFAILIKKVINQDGDYLLNKLDLSLLYQPRLALNVLFTSVNKEFIDLLEYINTIIDTKEIQRKVDIKQLQIALDETHAYADKIHLTSKDNTNWEYLISIIHILDHLQRLHERCEEDEDRAVKAKESKELEQIVHLLNRTSTKTIKLIKNKQWSEASKLSEKTTNTIQEKMHIYRDKITHQIANGKIDVHEGSNKLEAIRWTRRVSIHISRICYHLEKAVISAGK